METINSTCLVLATAAVGIAGSLVFGPAASLFGSGWDNEASSLEPHTAAFGDHTAGVTVRSAPVSAMSDGTQKSVDCGRYCHSVPLPGDSVVGRHENLLRLTGKPVFPLEGKGKEAALKLVTQGWSTVTSGASATLSGRQNNHPPFRNASCSSNGSYSGSSNGSYSGSSNGSYSGSSYSSSCGSSVANCSSFGSASSDGSPNKRDIRGVGRDTQPAAPALAPPPALQVARKRPLSEQETQAGIDSILRAIVFEVKRPRNEG